MIAFWRTLISGLRRLFSRRAADSDLNDELAHYLAMATEEHVRRGLAPADAARAARVQMGSFEAAKTEVRTGGWEAAVDSMRQDVRVAIRGLRGNPGFTITAVLSLALGIGANMIVFLLANAVMFRPLPYRDAGNLALIWTDDTRRGLHQESTAFSTVTDWRARSRAFSDIAYFSTQRVAPMSNDPARGRGRTRTALVSGNLFGVLGVAPFKGRLLTDEDEQAHAPVAVISYRFWQRWFAGADDVVGKSVTMDDGGKGGLGQITVVGVLPDGFFFPDKLTDIFMPSTRYWRFDRERSERFQAWARRWTGIGRLAPNASVVAAREDLDSIGRQLTAAFPTTVPDFPGFAATVTPVLDSIAGTNLRAALWMLLGAVGVVLLIVCANVANLQLARGTGRQREFAVRRALGATRTRIVRQLAVENFVLALLGGGVGFAIAAWGIRPLAGAVAAYVPRMDEVVFDARVMFFVTVASIASGLVFGTMPALRASAVDQNAALREGSRGTGTIRLRRNQSLFVLVQCTLALVLLTGAGLLLKSLVHVQSIDPGFDPNVLAVRIEFPPEPPPTAEERLQTSDIAPARARAHEAAMEDLMARVRSMPGVAAVAFSDDLFVAGSANDSITIPGRTDTPSDAGELNAAVVTASFFDAMHVPLRRGRFLTREDAAQKIRALWSPIKTDLPLAEKQRRAVPEPVVVNEAFVKRFFAGADPIGQRFCIDPTNKTYWYEIVGVVGDMRRGGLERAIFPEYYGPYFPSANGRADLVVRTAGNPASLATPIRAEVARALPGVTIVSMSTAASQFSAFTAQRSLQTWLLTLMAALALAIAAIGIFGLSHYAVAERTREIGVRVALGATPRDVLRLLVASGMRMPLIGIAVGLAASAALSRLITRQLYEVTPTDPAIFAGVAILLAFVAASACYLAAHRAARANPTKALSN